MMTKEVVAGLILMVVILMMTICITRILYYQQCIIVHIDELVYSLYRDRVSAPFFCTYK